jgi:CheY-like chemotaxis protein
MTLPADTPTALLISRDLFFTSKITGTAEALGTRVEVVADADAAARRVESEGFRCVFVDLADTGLDVAGFFASLSPENRPPVIAFGSHVATARLQAARDAGCDEVMPRSRFSTSLPELLKKYCGPRTT